MTITARYPSRCSSCGGSISVGDRIEWAKGSPVRHSSCPSSVTPAAPRRSSRGQYVRRTGCSCGSREDASGELIPAASNCEACNFDEYDC